MRIYLYGAGSDGRKALTALGQEKIDGFIDKNLAGQVKYGKHVYSLSDLDPSGNDLILIASHKYEKEIAQTLVENGFLHFVSVRELFPNQTKPLSMEEWGNVYYEELLQDICNKVRVGFSNSWTAEMLKLTQPGMNVMEIGCGSGLTSLSLAREGRVVTAIDNNPGSINLVKKAAEVLGLSIRVLCLDATKELPFEQNEFDVTFQAGLLEHFTTDQQISMLSIWKKYGKQTVSLVPNAHSVAYHFGKYIMEKKGTWEFGRETPVNSLAGVYSAAGIKLTEEYSIGFDDAIAFLPKDHYMRIAMEKMAEEVDPLEMDQGYLMVTMGVSE